jgi:hypothetical protein
MKPVHALAVLGSGALALWYIKKEYLKPPGSATPIYFPPVPQTPSSVPRTGPAPVAGPVQLATLGAMPGVRYRAAVDINGMLSVIANVTNVRKQAEGQGFTQTFVTKTRPADWPGAISADYYITGIYQGPPKTFDRSYAGGSVQVKDVWQG